MTIVFVALVGRCAVALWLPPTATFPDGHRYNRIASNILANGVYPESEEESAPLHPLLLAVLYSAAGENVPAARLMIAVLGSLTCYVMFKLGKVLFDPVVGLVAAALLAVYPLHVFTSALFEYPTCLFILLLNCTILLALGVRSNPRSWARWILTGMVLGLAALAVPTALTAAPFIALWLLRSCPIKYKARLTGVTLLILGCLSTVLPWSLYWYALTGHAQLITGGTAENFFKGNCPLAWDLGKADIADVYAEEGAPPEQRAAYNDYLQVESRARAWPAGPRRDKVYYDAVKAYYTARPREALGLLARKAAMYWLPYAKPVTKHRTDNNYTKILQFITFVPVALLALVGIWFARARWRELAIIYLVVITQWLTYSVFLVTARYRSQIDPLLILLASSVLVTWGRQLTRRRGSSTSPSKTP